MENEAVLAEVRAIRSTLDLLIAALVADQDGDPVNGLTEALESLGKAVEDQAVQVTRLTTEVSDLRLRLAERLREAA